MTAARIRYSACFTFDSKEVRNAFSRAVLDAVLESFPDAFAEEGVA